MSESRGADLVLILGLAGVGYALWKILAPVVNAAGTVASNVQAGVSAATTGAANAYVWATSPNIVPSGNVILPNDTVVPLSQLAVTFNTQYQAGLFSYGGGVYYIVSNPSGGPAYDQNGNYHAALTGNAPAQVTYAPSPGAVTPAQSAANAAAATTYAQESLPTMDAFEP